MTRTAHRSVQIFLPVLVALTVASRATAQVDALRTIQFETTQVTAPDVAVSPDGQFLIFTMLGKLFRLPVEGGEAEQLTFGPYYDNDPAISPDGKLVAFQSDRDGSEGNIFVLTLASKEIRQLTRESWPPQRPVWAPDGQSLVYLRLERRPNPPSTLVLTPELPPAVDVRRVRLAGGEPQTLHTALGDVRSPFHLADSRVGWAIVLRDSSTLQWKTRIEVRGADGIVSTLRLFNGAADPVIASPKADGLYARVADGIYAAGFAHQTDVLFAPLAGGTEQTIARISGAPPAGFAVSPDNASLYLGNLGHLWKVRLPGGQRQAVALRANVTLAIRQPTAPPKWTPVEPGSSAPLRTIRQPQLSPDGSQIVFRVLDRLWQQSLDGQARRLVVDSIGIERDPAFSPDGRQLAFVREAQGRQEIRVLELRSGMSRTVGPPAECEYEQLTWNFHGELVVAATCEHDWSGMHQIIAIEPGNGTRRVLARVGGWEPYPQLSADGLTLYFQAQIPPGSEPAFYRLQLEASAKPEPLLPAIADRVNISTRGQWVARTVPNRRGIRLSTIDGGRIAQTDVREFSEADGRDFSFTPDGAALLYVSGNRLWRQPLEGGAQQEIPIRLTLRAPTPSPVLLQRVRVLDFAAGGFGVETSLLIERGRIRWIGPAQGRALPQGTVTVDAGGRFAIPGLFDVHGHGADCGGAARIAYGVTSVRNMGGSLAWQNAHADRSDFTGDAIPRCFYAGEILEGSPGAAWFATFVHLFDEEDARAHVRLWQADGAQFIKLYSALPWPLQRAAADEARRLGLPVWAHGGLERAVKGVTLGYAGLTHWGRYYDDALQMFAAAGTRSDPTLGHSRGIEVFFRQEPERFRLATPPSPLRRFGENALRGDWAERLRTIRAAYRRGITFLPGTDTGPDGLALQWELEFLAEAGIPPLDVLRFATKSAAETVGAGADLGTLEIGKIADLILLDANPLDDIRNTQKIWRVFKGGWQFDPRTLRPGGQ